MEKAKVYFTDFRTPYGGASLPQKLQKLMKKAGIGNIDFEKQFVAIKMHFGE
ncbi:MAG: 4Fe-4S ferredoxin, partial [Phascolarctobacterium sp.]